MKESSFTSTSLYNINNLPKIGVLNSLMKWKERVKKEMVPFILTLKHFISSTPVYHIKIKR